MKNAVRIESGFARPGRATRASGPGLHLVLTPCSCALVNVRTANRDFVESTCGEFNEIEIETTRDRVQLPGEAVIFFFYAEEIQILWPVRTASRK